MEPDQNETQATQFRRSRSNPRTSRTMLPSKREVLLARLLLRVADTVAARDRDQEFLELYNEVKSICEDIVRHAS